MARYGSQTLRVALFFIAEAISTGKAPQAMADVAVAPHDGSNRVLFFDHFIDFEIAPAWATGGYRWNNSLWYSPPAPLARFSADKGILSIKHPAAAGQTSLVTLNRNTRDGYTFLFGTFQIKMRWIGDDPFVAFWLFSADHARGGDNKHWCEIDAVESFGNKKFVGTVHDWDNSVDIHNRNNVVNFAIQNYSWNVYTLVWNYDFIVWYLNGIELLRAHTPQICTKQKMFMIISSGSHSAKPSELQVEYIKVTSEVK